jgi:hypothetical protein
MKGRQVGHPRPSCQVGERQAATRLAERMHESVWAIREIVYNASK